ncbi:hypothetical protein ACFQZS_00520 [Mucilaginibacter calamicampi]|uniref:Cardiolipin synthase N-terminal domain-containing protein n=1 Tax=Mucilaginibacter calamicampi TaxID=1302352 RepID=A0ABW2YS95_9SPHI
MYSLFGNWYYIPLILQGLCLIHSFRNGTQQKWLWIIVFLPVIGSLIYLYQEILSNRRIKINAPDISAVFDPGVKLKRLENEVKFTDTFANRIKLADAYLDAGYVDKAVEIYTTSLTGAFAENEHVLAQLIVAYDRQGRYQEIIPIARKLYKLPQFARSRIHVLYAKALEHTGDIAAAEEEFKNMKGRYSYFENRFEYGLFLIRQDRIEDAQTIFMDIIEEQPHLSPVERNSNKVWFAKAKTELKKITA